MPSSCSQFGRLKLLRELWATEALNDVNDEQLLGSKRRLLQFWLPWKTHKILRPVSAFKKFIILGSVDCGPPGSNPACQLLSSVNQQCSLHFSMVEKQKNCVSCHVKNDIKFKFQCQWIKFYWNTPFPICVHVVYGCFHPIVEEFSSCDRDWMTCNI